MPVVDGYIAEVTLTVRLRTEGAGVVGEYTITRKARGSSMTPSEKIDDMKGVVRVTEDAVVSCVSAHHGMQAGLQNTERRRLK